MATKLAAKDTSALITGGASQITFFKMVKNTTNDHWEITTPAGTSGASVTAVTGVTDNVFAAQLVESFAPTYQEDGTITATITNLQDDETFETFLETYCHTGAVAATSDMTEHTLEDGTKLGASSASLTNPLLMVASGGVGRGDKRKVTCAVVTVNVASGSWSTSSNDYNQPTFEVTSHLLSYDVVVPVVAFDARLVKITGEGAATAVTIATNHGCKNAFLPKGDGTYPA